MLRHAYHLLAYLSLPLRLSAWQDEKDQRDTRVARGPQLKILHHCKKKLEELGIETNSENDKQSSVPKNNKGDMDGKCTVCWVKEIQVPYKRILTTQAYARREPGWRLGWVFSNEYTGCGLFR